jgi:hypothetical protein
MQSTRLSPAVWRRLGLTSVVIALIAFVTPAVFAEEIAPPDAPQQQQPAAGGAPQPAKAATRIFTSDAGMLFNQIKPDKTADFEMVMGKLKEALMKSDKPERKQQAASWKIFKSVEAGQGGNVLYIFILDPAVKNVDYTVSTILAEAFPTEVQALFKVYADSLAAGQNLVNLQLINDLGK